MRAWLLVVMLVSFPCAEAWTLAAGVQFGGDSSTTITTGDTFDIVSTVFWEPTTDALVVNGFVLDLRADDGVTPYDWTLLKIDVDNVTLSANTTVQGSFRFAGFNGLWVASGVYGEADFNIIGPSTTFVVPAGNQTITLHPQGSFTSGPRLALNALYASANKSINAIVVLTNGDGSALTGAAGLISVQVFTANDAVPVLVGSINVTELGTTGTYLGGFPLPNPTYGHYVVAASYGSLNDAQTVLVPQPSVNPLQLSDTFVGSLTLANVLVMLLWFAAFLWTAHRRYLVCAVFAWVGIISPLYVSGFGITFVTIASIFLLLLLVYVIKDWRDSYREDAKLNRSTR